MQIQNKINGIYEHTSYKHVSTTNFKEKKMLGNEALFKKSFPAL